MIELKDALLNSAKPRHKFKVGTGLYFKPVAFAPLQVRPGGRCTVLEQLEGGDEEIWYEIHLEFEKQNRVVQERELTEPQFGMASGQK